MKRARDDSRRFHGDLQTISTARIEATGLAATLHVDTQGADIQSRCLAHRVPLFVPPDLQYGLHFAILLSMRLGSVNVASPTFRPSPMIVA